MILDDEGEGDEREAASAVEEADDEGREGEPLISDAGEPAVVHAEEHLSQGDASSRAQGWFHF